MSGFVDSSGLQHIYTLGETAVANLQSGVLTITIHVVQFLWTGSQWINQDLTSLADSPNVMGSSISAFLDAGGGQHVFYWDPNLHVARNSRREGVDILLE